MPGLLRLKPPVLPPARLGRREVRVGKGMLISLAYFLLIRGIEFLGASPIFVIRISPTRNPAIAKAANPTAGIASLGTTSSVDSSREQQLPQAPLGFSCLHPFKSPQTSKSPVSRHTGWEVPQRSQRQTGFPSVTHLTHFLYFC